MKTFYRTTIALCLSLTILFLTIGAAAADGSIEIRGPVGAAAGDTIEIIGPLYDGHDINDYLVSSEVSLTMDATQSAAFYQNI